MELGRGWHSPRLQPYKTGQTARPAMKNGARLIHGAVAVLLLAFASLSSAQYLGGKDDAHRYPLSPSCPGASTDLVYVHVTTSSVIGQGGSFPQDRCVTAVAGAELTDAQCIHDATQRFSLRHVYNDTYGIPWYQLRLVTTNLCWQAAGPYEGGQSGSLVLAVCNYSPLQLFSFTPLAKDSSKGNTYEISPQSDVGMCLHVANDDAAVQLLDCSTISSTGFFATSANMDGFEFGAATPVTNVAAYTYHTPCAQLPRSCDSAPEPAPYLLGSFQAQDTDGLLMCASLQVSENASGPCAGMDINRIRLDSVCPYGITNATWYLNSTNGVKATSLKWSTQQFGNVSSIQLWHKGGAPIASADELRLSGGMQLCITLVQQCDKALQTSVLFDSSGLCCPFSFYTRAWTGSSTQGYDAEEKLRHTLYATWGGTCNPPAALYNTRSACGGKPATSSETITAAIYPTSINTFGMDCTCPQKQCAASLAGIQHLFRTGFASTIPPANCIGFKYGSDAGQFRFLNNGKFDTLTLTVVKHADGKTNDAVSKCKAFPGAGCSKDGAGKVASYTYTCNMGLKSTRQAGQTTDGYDD